MLSYLRRLPILLHLPCTGSEYNVRTIPETWIYLQDVQDCRIRRPVSAKGYYTHFDDFC